MSLFTCPGEWLYGTLEQATNISFSFFPVIYTQSPAHSARNSQNLQTQLIV